MSEFSIHSVETAPEGSEPILSKAEATMGFVPNLYGVLAESPALLEAYTTVGKIFDRSSFDPVERQVVLLSTSFVNGCDYCMAAHSTIASMQKVPADVVAALRAGEPLADPRLRALADFTRRVVEHRGWVPPTDVQAFLDAGFSRAQVLEVVLGIGMKTLSNYANHMTRTPIDPAFQPNAWTPPEPASA